MLEAAAGRPRLREELARALHGLPIRRKAVRFLLGSDEDIRHETRVALIPRQMAALGETLAAAGMEPELLMLAGAGERAGYSDREYAAAGVRVVGRSELSSLKDLDVVHALKEPTDYESEIPGPFLRLGALHLASYPPGVCRMLGRKNFAAIFDGGTVGSCSYLLHGGDRTPIVASMSRFAGSVAGLKLVEGLEANRLGAGKIVVVGGGIAGLAAIDEIRSKLGRLVVVEPYPPTQERLPALLAERGITEFAIEKDLADEAIRDAVGIVFAHRSGAKAAEKVCTYEQIRHMKPGAAIVDIAIDQGGSIRHDDYCEDDCASTSREKYKALLADYFYYAETNMPREVPRRASECHGDAAWIYVAALIALAARHGGPRRSAEAILGQPVRRFGPGDALGDLDLLDCLFQDLRNGLQLVTNGVGADITDPEVEGNPTLVHWVHACARR